MKKVSLLILILIPALLLFTGASELYIVYLLQDSKTSFIINLNGFFINLLYGITVGLIYILYEGKKADKWSISIPKFLLLLLPMLMVSIYFMLFKSKSLPILIDTMGLPYLNFTDIYYGESLAAHLSYFCSGFFLIFIFSKNNALKRKQSWIKNLSLSITFILLIFVISFIIDKVLAHAIDSQNFSYYAYEFIVLFTNMLFGMLIWKILNLEPDTFKKPKIKKASTLIADLILAVMASIPFIFIYISYHTNFTVPYNNPYYSYLRFFRQSDFFQIFQMLFGLILIPSIKNVVSIEK